MKNKKLILKSKIFRSCNLVLPTLVVILCTFIFNVFPVSAETYEECYMKCVNEKGTQNATVCQTDCKELNSSLKTFNGVTATDPAITSTTEGYNYYRDHGALNENASAMNYAEQVNAQPQPKKFNYILLEAFPGFFGAGSVMTDFPGMILAIYKFGIWTIGIAGLFMLVIGGFMYMSSAGNNSTLTSAKGIIWDALLGIVAALGAYLFLYVINPDLTKINISFVPVGVEEEIKSLSICSEGTRACATANMTIFGARAAEAAKVCQGESRGDANSKSNLDKCKDGNSFSIGLFQINMIAHGASLGCGDVFQINGTQTLQGNVLERINGVPSKYDCSVKPDKMAKYNECVQKLQNPEENKRFANNLRNSVSKWYPTWSAARPCGF